MELFDGSGYVLTRLLIQRGLAAVYLVAFLVAVNQFLPLCGRRGLLPARERLARLGFWDAPSLFHWTSSDRTFRVAAWAGAALAAFALAGLSERFGLAVSIGTWAALWALYLSFVNAGGLFYGYGWETLICEAGFLAVFLGPAEMVPALPVLWLFKWLAFRVMFGAGLIKLRGDPCWRDLTCLEYHYETQPMPNPLSWFLHRSPRWFHKLEVAATHFVQLVAGWGLLAPAPASWIAGVLVVGFQLTLVASGNLSWLNWLTIVVALSAFSDPAIEAVAPLAAPAGLAPRPAAFDAAVAAVVLLVAGLSVRPVRNLFARRQLMNASFEPLRLVNTYGAFGSVTRERLEVVLEGTDAAVPDEGAEWREYGFRGKPGDPRRMPPWAAPYHLRLDWQMWFAALAPSQVPLWMVRLVERLLEGDRAVSGLLRHDPFRDAPPRHVRAGLWRYRFTTAAERRAGGGWWSRTRVGEYLPAVSLADLARS